jgi:hypothetical protein
MTPSRDEVLDLWAKLNVLCGVLSLDSEEGDFPQGRDETARQMALRAYQIVDGWVSK